MKFGVNYTPSHNWFYFWLHPDWDAVAKDLDDIASIGLDHIRIFPLWTILQPNRTWINDAALDDLRHMAAMADERGLDVYSDVIQGHMSSFDFVPSWLVSWHETNMFTDPDAVQAQARLIASVYEALADLPHFRGLTIGNECNQFTDRVHPRRMPSTFKEAEDWLLELMTPMKERASQEGRVLLHSENDATWYQDGHVFLPRYASNIGDMTCIHSWVFNGAAQECGPLAEESTRHAEYLVELSKAFANQPHRQVWLQEIGAPLNVMGAGQAADFCRSSVEHALDCSDMFGITWWCSHDVDQRFGDFPPFEHQLGLFDQERHLKPIGQAFAQAVKDYSGKEDSRPRSTALVVDVDEHDDPLLRSACAPGGSIFNKWMELSRQGARPTLVTSLHAADSSWLQDRGINECTAVKSVGGSSYSAVSDPSLLREKS